MKILWFANSPANGVKYFDRESVRGGWVQSLDELLQEKIELHVAFYYPGHFKSFQFGKTTYYPISRKNWKIMAVKASLLNEVVYDEDLDLYLGIVNRVKPDLIHIHGTENPFGYLQQHVSIPVVISLQGIIHVIHHKYAVGIEDKYLKTPAKSITQGIKEYLLNGSFFKAKKGLDSMKKRESVILKQATNIIGRTNWDRRVNAILAPQSTYYHNEEMLRTSFYDHEWQEKDPRGRFIIFTTNDNSPFKGLETICKALDLLNQLNIEVEWQVAGIAPDDLVVNIVKKKLKLDFPAKNLILLGKQPEKVILQHLLAAHLYVMPSHIENSPNNLCEAMILGLPCLAVYVGGTPSILENSISGILIQDGDPWAMAGTIREIQGNYAASVLMGKKAREIALKRHDRDKNIAGLLGIYATIVDQYKKNGGK